MTTFGLWAVTAYYLKSHYGVRGCWPNKEDFFKIIAEVG